MAGAPERDSGPAGDVGPVGGASASGAGLAGGAGPVSGAGSVHGSRHRRPADPQLGLRVPWLRGLVWVGVLGLIVLPLAAVILTGLSGAGLAALRQPGVAQAALNSVVTSGASALAATAFALLLAVCLDRLRVPGAGVLRWVFLLPFLIPPFIGAMSWIALLSPRGPVSTLLATLPGLGPVDIYGPGGVILLLSIHSYPMSYLILTAGLARIPADYEDVARLAGASPARVFATVTLPLLRPALIASLVLTFTANLSDFGIPALLGLPEGYTTLTTLVYRFIASASVTNPLPAASAIGVALLGLTALAVLAQTRLAGGRDVSGIIRARGDRRLGHGRAAWLVAGGLWAVAVCVTVLPLLALSVQALLPAPGIPLRADTVTLGNFVRALTAPATLSGLQNSVVLAVGAGLVCTVLGLALALVITRTRARDNVALDLAAIMPQALPGLVIAVAWLLIGPLLGVHNTLWAILGAYVMAFTALVVQMVRAPLASIPRSLEEAARMSGAGPMRALLATSARIVLPAAAAGGIVVALTAVRELTISILLVAPGVRTLGVTIFNLQQAGDYNTASALAVLVAAVGILGLSGASALQRLSTRRRRPSRSAAGRTPARTDAMERS